MSSKVKPRRLQFPGEAWCEAAPDRTPEPLEWVGWQEGLRAGLGRVVGVADPPGGQGPQELRGLGCIAEEAKCQPGN